MARRLQTTRNEDYLGDPPEMSCTTTPETTYYVYASALGGVKLIELNASGNKVKGYVYGNGQRIAVQAVWSGGFSVSYHHANPGMNSWAETSSDRSVSRREMGPLGEEVGIYDPYIMLESPSYVDVSVGPVFLEAGDPFDLGSGCGTIDGLPASCSEVQRRLQAGTLEASISYPSRKPDPDQPPSDPNPTRWVPNTSRIQDLGLGIYAIDVPTLRNIDKTWGTVYFTVPQDQAVLLSREEVSGLIDEIYQMFKNHPGCEESTNKLLDELKNSTGYGVGTIRDVLEDFRKNGNVGVYQSEDRAGSAGNGTINISSRVRLEKDAALIMAEIIHSTGWPSRYPGPDGTGSTRGYYNDEAMANAYHRLGVVMSIAQYRKTYPEWASQSAKDYGYDYTESKLAHGAIDTTCMGAENLLAPKYAKP